MSKCKRILMTLLTLIVMFGAPLRVFGADTSFVENYVIWNHCDKVKVILNEIGGYSGCMQYFYEDNCFYGHISYDEDSMSNHGNHVSVNVNVENQNRAYRIEIENDSERDNEFCKIYKSFTPDTKYGQDIYFIIEFDNKEDKNTVNLLTIEISVNSNSYVLAENMAVGENTEGSHDEENKTVQNKTTRKNESKDKEDKENGQTKFHYEGQNEKTDDDTGSDFEENEENEKFSAGSVQNSEGNSSSDENFSQSESYEENNETQKKSELSTGAKAMLAGSGVLGLAGVSMIMKSVISQAIEKEIQKRSAESVSKVKQEETKAEE